MDKNMFEYVVSKRHSQMLVTVLLLDIFHET